jgi:hypothetical protein
MSDLLIGVALIAFGFLVYRCADWVGRLHSSQADRWERDGVIRPLGGPFGKVWKKDSPRRFSFRVNSQRASGAFSRLFLKVFGIAWVLGGFANIAKVLFR